MTAAALTLSLLVLATPALAGNLKAPQNASPETRACVECHAIYTPGIVADWLGSRHAATTLGAALARQGLERRVSASGLPPGLSAEAVVGCYECHALRGERHRDSFKHMGRRVHVVVTPDDCATCHPQEAEQYAGSKKAHALDNLEKNPVYRLLVETVDSVKVVHGTRLESEPASSATKQETCLGCHGTRVEVTGTRRIETAIGPLTVPALSGWPNQGVGRVNPDGSRGSCAACHARHGFRISDARHPYTCGQCHLEPDVPAWNVYKESKHGNIYEAREAEWNYEAVPWRLGLDFAAPTCAVCHNSLLVDARGKVVAERNHDFGSRLWVRLFGLIYTHPQPKAGATWKIHNADGQPLPTTFDDRVAGADYLIGAAEQERRLQAMERVCRGCHSASWTAGHFAKLAATDRETDRMVAAATGLMQAAWKAGLAQPANPFDEPAELLWVRQWLFYANSVRYASAMSGAPDYAAFKNGWWSLTETVAKLAKEAAAAGKGPVSPRSSGAEGRPSAGGSTAP